MEKIQIPAGVLQRAASAASQTNAPGAPPASAPTQTRAQFYARKNGGGMRTARKQFLCQTFGCMRVVQPGEDYLDTMEVTTWPATKRICACCAEGLV